MGEGMEVTIVSAGADVLVQITERQVDVLRLIGRDGLTYKAAALQLSNRQVRLRDGAPPPHLSHHTVRRYANEIREMFGLGHVSPMRAMWVIYRDHRDTIEEVE